MAKKTDSISKMKAFCRREQIEVVGITYCYKYRDMAEGLAGELRGELSIKSASCTACKRPKYTTMEREGGWRLSRIKSEGVGLNLLLGLCPEQKQIVLSESHVMCVEIETKPNE